MHSCCITLAVVNCVVGSCEYEGGLVILVILHKPFDPTNWTKSKQSNYGQKLFQDGWSNSRSQIRSKTTQSAQWVG